MGRRHRATASVVRQVFENGLADEILLNVNVPFLPDDKIRGICLTRQGLRVYHSRLDERTDPRSKPYYWIGGDARPACRNAGRSGHAGGGLCLGHTTPIGPDGLQEFHRSEHLAVERSPYEPACSTCRKICPYPSRHYLK